MNTKLGNDVFEATCDLVETTSLHRPDTAWIVTDAKGHEHRWYVDGAPATSYNATARHETPTLIDVHDGWGYWEDGERYGIHHFECRQCGEHIEPRYTADTNRQYTQGLRRYSINGQPVPAEEFQRRLELARD